MAGKPILLDLQRKCLSCTRVLRQMPQTRRGSLCGKFLTHELFYFAYCIIVVSHTSLHMLAFKGKSYKKTNFAASVAITDRRTWFAEVKIPFILWNNVRAISRAVNSTVVNRIWIHMMVALNVSLTYWDLVCSSWTYKLMYEPHKSWYNLYTHRLWCFRLCAGVSYKHQSAWQRRWRLRSHWDHV